MKVLEKRTDHPCGTQVKVKIPGFPVPEKDNKVGFEKVVGYEGDTVINRWSIPVEKNVFPIFSKSIYIPYKNDALRINADGSY